MVLVPYGAGDFELKVLFDPINHTYIILEKGQCYLMTENLWQNFENFLASLYTGNRCPLESWQTQLDAQNKEELVVIPTDLNPDEFFSEFSVPDK